MAKRGRKTHRNTEGHKLLRAYLETSSQVALATALGIGQQTISAWKRKTCRPEPHHRDALARIAGIPVESWYSPDELAVSRGDSTRDVTATGSGAYPASGRPAVRSGTG